MSTDARIPMNSATLPIDTAVARSCCGKYRAATLVMLLSTKGWPAAITTWPASWTPNEDGASTRMIAPPPVSSAPTASARANRVSSHRPTGSASTT